MGGSSPDSSKVERGLFGHLEHPALPEYVSGLRPHVVDRREQAPDQVSEGRPQTSPDLCAVGGLGQELDLVVDLATGISDGLLVQHPVEDGAKRKRVARRGR